MPTITNPQELASAIEDADSLILRWGHGQMRQLPAEEIAMIAAALRQPTEVVTLLETLTAEATPEMIAAVSTILQPYAAKLVWQRMLLAARSTTRDEPQSSPMEPK